MPIHVVRCLGLSLLAIAVLGSLSNAADGTPAAIDCASLAHWTKFAQPPQVNQLHVFCGEWKRQAPTGFHSRPAGLLPGTVAGFKVTQPANAQGVYGGSWSYAGQPHSVKFSTMFPDSCSMQQVLNSIVYAAAHPRRCPANAPDWAVCGPNRPPSTGSKPTTFCAADDGTVFLIAMAKLSGGRVNSAFPLR
jgi:hypothetical protein